MDNIKRTGKSGRRLLVILVLEFVSVSALLPGCSPKIIEKVVVQHDTMTVYHRDSIHHRDSIYVKEWVKGDTVHHYEFQDRYIYKDRWRDSISIKEVHDTTTVEKKVEKELTASQKMKINSFWYLLAGLLGFALWTFRKPILKLIKTLI